MNTYQYLILVDRDRDCNGEYEKDEIKAANDLEAIIYILENYNMESYYNFEDFDEEISKLRKMYEKNKEEAIKEALQLLETSDLSDYYDNLGYLKNNDRVLFEDEAILNWFEEDLS